MDDVKKEKSKVPSVRRKLVAFALPWLLPLIIWVSAIAKDAVQAQVVEGVGLVHELPVTKVKVETMEADIKDIKVDLREQRNLLYENQRDVKYLIKKFDTKYGSR